MTDSIVIRREFSLFSVGSRSDPKICGSLSKVLESRQTSDDNSCALLGHRISRKAEKIMQCTYPWQLLPYRLCRSGQFGTAQKETWTGNLIYRSIKQPSIQVALQTLLQLFWAQTLALFPRAPCTRLQDPGLLQGCARSPALNLVFTLLPEYEPVATGSEASPIAMPEWERKKNHNQSVRDSNCTKMLSI